MRFNTISKSLLLFGFLGVTTAVLIAYQNPATGYELSIYTETPGSVWLFSSSALLASVLIVFSESSRSVRTLGVFLGGLTMTTIVSLPIIRGYYYVGATDSLSHLGTARDMNEGLMPVTESLYPVVHILSSALHDVTGLTLPHTVLVLVVVFVICFFVFVPLVVRELTGDIWTTYIGLFSGLLLLPINHLSPSLYIHPTSQALMYTPALLFVFLILYRQRIVRHSAMFLLVAPMFVLLHPQQAGNLVLFFGVIAAMQIGYDFRRGYRLERREEWVLPEVAIFTTVFWLWSRNFEIAWSSLEAVYTIPFRETQAAGTTATRSVSLAEIGGSLPEVFVKLFLVSFVYVVLTGLLVSLVVWVIGTTRSRTFYDTVVPDGGTGSDQMLLLYIFSGLAALSMVFFAFLVGGISDQYFRHLGMLMVLATVLGSIAIGRGMWYLNFQWSDSSARKTITVVLIIFIVLSLPVVFASPYIYYSSDHVTKMQTSGYETTFEYQEDSITFDNVRSSTSRYGNAIQGREIPREAYYQEGDPGIPDHFADRSLRTHYDESVYVPVPEADRVRDPVLWKGFRFSHEDFAYLDAEPGINKVQANGGYDLYLVEPVDNSM